MQHFKQMLSWIVNQQKIFRVAPLPWRFSYAVTSSSRTSDLRFDFQTGGQDICPCGGERVERKGNMQLDKKVHEVYENVPYTRGGRSDDFRSWSILKASTIFFSGESQRSQYLMSSYFRFQTKHNHID